MDDTQSQAEAGAGSESETAPQGEADSLNNPGKEQSFDERLQSATSAAEVDQIIADLEAGKFKPTKAEESPEAGANETPQNEEGGEAAKPEGETPEGEAAAATTPATTTDPAGEQQPPENTEAKKDGDGDSEGKLPERIRITNFSKVEKLALQLKREDPKLTLAEAESRAKAALGIKDETPAEQATESTLPKTVSEADAKIKELKALRTKASTEDLNFAEADRLTNEIEALQEHKITLREHESERKAAEQRAYNEAYDRSEAKAAELYPFIKQQESAAYKRMAEIDRQLEENKDPLFDSPDKPLKIAQMVAAELNIAPRSRNAPVVAKPAAPAQTQAQKRTVPPVASGSSRTSQSTTQGSQLSAEIQSARTQADIDRIMAKLGVPA